MDELSLIWVESNNHGFVSWDFFLAENFYKSCINLLSLLTIIFAGSTYDQGWMAGGFNFNEMVII